jgi:hypothetical protein
MIRKLLMLLIVLSLGVVLVSPCVDGDDAIHHHPHHHHFGLSPDQGEATLVTVDDSHAASAEQPSLIVGAKLMASALRC